MGDDGLRDRYAVDAGVTTEAVTKKSEDDESRKAQKGCLLVWPSSSAFEPKQFTPTDRPLIEPPIFDYDDFIEHGRRPAFD